MVSSPLRAIPLLSISSPCRGILFYRHRERARGRLVLIDRGLEESRVVALMYTCIRTFKLMYVWYKSKNILTLVTIGYIVGFIIGMYIEYCLWAQVAVLNHKLSYWTVWDSFMQVLYLSRAPYKGDSVRFS